MEVTTDVNQHQDMVNVSKEVWERGGGGRVCDGEGLRDRVFTTCAVMVYDFMVTVIKSECEVWAREDGIKVEAVTE